LAFAAERQVVGLTRNMAQATLQWAEKARPIEITSRSHLETRLREVARESVAHPILATLSMPDGSYGYIGLGREESIMFLHGPRSPDGWTEEWIPIGQEERKGFTEFFLLGEHHSEFENRSLLPIGDAIRAIGDFFEHGSRPDWIRWEENRF
jgi:hypothetical protein